MRPTLPYCGLFTLLPMLLSTPPRPADAAVWLDEAWSHRIALTAQPEQIAGTDTLPDVTLLLTLDAGYLSTVFDTAKTDGSDLLFTAGDGVTVLPHEVVSYDPVGKAAELWFRTTALSDSLNVFYMYYGNPDTTVVPIASDAWSADHLAVYHFDQDPTEGELSDSSPSNNSGIVGDGSLWTSDDLVAGPVGHAWRFDDNTEWVYAPNVSSPDSSFTISGWYSNAAAIDGGSCAFQAQPGYFQVFFQHNDMFDYPSLETSKGFIIWNPVIADTLAHQYVWSLDAVADTARFYFDGVEQPVLFQYAPNPPFKVYTGETVNGRMGIAGPVFYNPLDLVDGVVDEYRLVQGAQNTDRVATEYRNQSDPHGFFTYTVEEGGGVVAVAQGPSAVHGAGSIAAWPNPCSGVAQVTVDMDSPSVRIAVYDVAGRLVRAFPAGARSDRGRLLVWDGRDDRGTAVGNGIYYVRAQGQHAALQTKLLMIR